MEEVPRQRATGSHRKEYANTKTHKDSPEGLLDASRQVLGSGFDWPKSIGEFSDRALQKRARATFDLITARRAIEDWDDYSLSMAARLARLQVSVEQAEATYLSDPAELVVFGMAGGRTNPVIQSVSLLTQQMRVLATALGLHSVDQDTAKSIAEHLRSAKAAKAAINGAKSKQPNEDSLLA